MEIYLAARYSRHPEMQRCAAELVDLGHEVTSRWIWGEHQAVDEEILIPEMQERAIRFLRDDLDDLYTASAVIAFTEEMRTPTRGGRHVEWGIALALGLELYVVGPRENLFYLGEEVSQYDSFPELIEAWRNDT